ncbi:MAG: malto-oligosyltrehalose synthase [Geminicoccaceae bacterium]|nr:MAG: malto-oligosyltrehalose synthase [Geminicoccaceae bacterium]
MLVGDEGYVAACAPASSSHANPPREHRLSRRLRATYRLQINAAFDLDAARGVVPYLAELGISHLYLSPIWAARPGSTHGYDVVDHAAINPEFGGAEAFDRLVGAAHAANLGLIVDCVPNHMGIGYANPWWRDVLMWGETSPYANFFDIDWKAPEPTLEGKVLLPILGDHYGRVLEDGQLQADFDGGWLVVRYYDNAVPVFPRDTAEILEAAASCTEGSAADTLRELAQAALKLAKRRERVSRQRRRADRDRAQDLAQRIEAARSDPGIEAALGQALQALTPDRLHRLLERQAYRLAFWRLASQEINYRRFFDINDLAGLRVEDNALFDAAHALVLELVAEGAVDGVRLDHVDGLLDPQGYLARLRRLAKRPDGTPAWLFVEKILGEGEAVPASWPVDGTTGYEVMRLLHLVQVDPACRRPLLVLYRSLTESGGDFHAEVVNAKRFTMATSLAAELNVLAGDLNRLAKASRLTRDYGRPALREALRNVVAQFPIYRTYVGAKGPSEADRAAIGRAVRRARRAATTPDLSIYDFLESIMTTDAATAGIKGLRPAEVRRFAMRLQQYTGPVTAKSVEDTAFYRWFPLVSLNEVGSEPTHFGLDVAAFHAENAARQAAWPLNLVASATHDHKRGEDVRARLAVLSERPQAWSRALRRWFRLAEPLVAATEDGPAPSPNDVHLFFQMVVGAWPLALAADDAAGLEALAERLQGYMQKAIREAKRQTSWAVMDEVYEASVREFVAAALDPDQSPRLLGEIASFVGEIARAGALNGLAQTLLKLTIPGVPDIYQGTEDWDLSLVDPDNRRPVDYAGRRRALEQLRAGDEVLAAWSDAWPDGRIKLALVARLLRLRAGDPDLFEHGRYVPLPARGAGADHVIAFARVMEQRALVVVAPRLVSAMMEDGGLAVAWGDTSIALDDLGFRPARAHDAVHDRNLEIDHAALPLRALARPLPLLAVRIEAGAGSGHET